MLGLSETEGTLEAPIGDGPMCGPTCQPILEAGFLDEIVASEEVVGLAKDRAIELAKYLDPRAFAGTRRSMRGEITERLRKSLEL